MPQLCGKCGAPRAARVSRPSAGTVQSDSDGTMATHVIDLAGTVLRRLP